MTHRGLRPSLVILAVLAACSTPVSGESTPNAGSAQAAAPENEQPSHSREYGTFGDGVPVEVFAPEEVGPWPVVLLVHGGGWFSGEPAAMAPLADDLASGGAVVFNIGYRTGRSGGTVMDMASDVACGVAHARREAARFTTTPDPVTAIGHSAGAHLISLVALRDLPCPDGGDSEVESVIGLAGPYDVTRVSVLAPLVGGTLDEVPEAWGEIDPYSHLDTASPPRFFLVHGTEDNVVPLEFSEQFAAALDDAGIEVALETVDGATHGDVNDPDVVGGLVMGALQ